MNQLTNFLTQPILLGLIWGMLALGVFISYRVLDIADLGVEGVLPLSAVTTLYLINAGVDPLLSLLICIVIGAACGVISSCMHLYLKIPSLLSGIIMMTGLFSIVVVISKGNISLNMGETTIFTWLNDFFKNFMMAAWANYLGTLIICIFIMAICVFALYWFFGTQVGVSLRATGKNKLMSRAQGINTNQMELLGMAISSGLIALSGSLLAQYQTYASSMTGKGTIVIGLAILFLGEAIFGRKSFKTQLISIVIGGFLYWYIINGILLIPGFDANLLYLLQAILIVLILAVPMIIKKIKRKHELKVIKEKNNVTD